MASQQSSKLFIGLMSGTSLDSIDGALVEFKHQHAKLLDSIEYPIPSALRQQLIDLCQPGDNEINRLGVADRALAKEFANAVKMLLKQSGYQTDDITAIGSHGQTIRHHPNINNGFTLQIGDPNTIAYETGITTVADFRRKDLAAGGQGAPLAPAFHKAFFADDNKPRAIINIGGMSNITLLSANGLVSGYDIGPGNILMDGWIQQHKQRHFDIDGTWAASGQANNELLKHMLAEPYFSAKAPKSTGRELFNLDWLMTKIDGADYRPEDIQTTLLALTVSAISNDLKELPITVNNVFICGGGAYNKQMMLQLEAAIHPRVLSNTMQLGIPPEWVEACGFAWLASQTLQQLPGNQPSVTGASQSLVLGTICF